MHGGHVCLSSVLLILFWTRALSGSKTNQCFPQHYGVFTSTPERTHTAGLSTAKFLPLLDSMWNDLRRHVVIGLHRKRKFLPSRVSYYPNAVSCFNQTRLLLSGDAQLNPGPAISISSNSSTSLNAKLNCVLLNSRSLCNKLHEFQGLVYGHNLDVVAVTETWLHDGYLDNEILSADFYTIFRKDRESSKRGGGVLLAVKADILAYRRPDLEPLNSEILVGDLVSPNSFKITFCLCYRPPNCSLFIDFF